MYAGIEAGGTKFVCAVSDEKLNILQRISFPTTLPEETIDRVSDFFNKFEHIKSIGIGSFGPVDIDENSKTYGYITSTPKPGWRDYNFLGDMKSRYSVPIAWNTDVNAACLAEYEFGAAKDVQSAVYLTLGTGIGGGAIQSGHFIGGISHPEMGHIAVRRHPDDDFEGWCPYHKDCLEGLAAGPSVEKRLGIRGENVDKNHKIWEILAYYIAQGLTSYSLILRPERIILGGGLSKNQRLIELIRNKTFELAAGYISLPEKSRYIVLPKFGDNAGIMGALVLAEKIYKGKK